jgi:putative hydrolase of the HAD superfamily
MYETMNNQPFDVIAFDIGGVLVQLTGVPRMLEWLQSDADGDMWNRWLLSESVRSFETGKCTAEEFASAVCAEFALPVAPDAFLEEFVTWAHGVFPGAHELLRALRPHYQLVSLSNNNSIHWSRIRDEMKLADLFDRHFLSHEIGLIKPDREVFEHVVAALGIPAERILYFDDNRLNVEQARAVGMSAHRTVGLEAVIAKLAELNIITSNR